MKQHNNPRNADGFRLSNAYWKVTIAFLDALNKQPR